MADSSNPIEWLGDKKEELDKYISEKTDSIADAAAKKAAEKAIEQFTGQREPQREPQSQGSGQPQPQGVVDGLINSVMTGDRDGAEKQLGIVGSFMEMITGLLPRIGISGFDVMGIFSMLSSTIMGLFGGDEASAGSSNPDENEHTNEVEETALPYLQAAFNAEGLDEGVKTQIKAYIEQINTGKLDLTDSFAEQVGKVTMPDKPNISEFNTHFTTMVNDNGASSDEQKVAAVTALGMKLEAPSS